MFRNAIFLILICALFTACGTSAVPAATPLQTQIPIASSVPAMTVIQVTDAEGNKIEVPDPRVSNPELFDTSDPQSLVTDFTKAFGADSKNLIAELSAESKEGVNGQFIIMKTPDGIPLLMATKVQGGVWKWERVGLSNLLSEITGKHIGLYISGEEFTGSIVKQHAADYFGHGGILALNDQIPEWAEMNGAHNEFQFSNENDMSLMINRLAGPGHFSGLNTANIEKWLEYRVSISTQIINKGSGSPALINFNEILKTGSAAWNPRGNPLRDKYGDQWFEKYLEIALKVLLTDGYVPNKDFYLMVNETDLYDNQSKVDYLVKVLTDARTKALAELSTDSEVAPILKHLEITDPEQIPIVVGAETNINLNGTVQAGISAPPTPEMIDGLAEDLKVVGPLLMTEVNPMQGSANEKEQFLANVLGGTHSQNLMGLVLWDVYFPSGDPILGQETIGLFDQLGYPTPLAFALMKKIGELSP